MRTADVIKSKYIRGKDLKGKPPLTLTIADVTEEIMGRGGRQEVKCILWFSEDLRGISLNSSRVAILESAYGPETDQWSGKKVRLYFDPAVKFGGEMVGGVGLRTPPGVVYQGNGAQPGWGDAPRPAAPAGAPPPPYWDGANWVFPQPPPPAAAPAAPPAPIWNGTSQQWEVLDPATGQMIPITAAAPAPAAQPKHVPPPTIKERIDAGNPPRSAAPVVVDDWGPLPPQGQPDAGADFNDDIPF
jgi:hypothetical protein